MININPFLYVATPSTIGGAEINFNHSKILPYNYTIGGGTEYELFKEIYIKCDSGEPWGLVSSKFNFKTSIDIKEFYDFALDKLFQGYDCVYINPMIINEAIFANVWEQGVIVGHKGIDLIYNFLIKKNNLKLNVLSDIEFSFCNYFIANNKFWNGYFSFVDKCILQLEDEARIKSEIGQIYIGSAGYHKNNEMSMRPFVIERLLSLFISLNINNNKINFTRFEHLESHYIKKAGFHYGKLLYNLKCLKKECFQDKKSLNLWNFIRSEIINNRSVFHGLLHFDDPDIKLINYADHIAGHMEINNIKFN